MILRSNTVSTAAAILAVTSSGSCQSTTRTINVPTATPSSVSQNIDPSFPGFAFEQSSFYNYSFNAQGKPNVFSQNLVNAVLSRTGGTPLLRVGGTSGDAGNFSSSQNEATNFPATKYGPQFKGGLTISPSYFEAFKNWPGAKFEFMVPFHNTSRSHSLKWAEAGMNHIGTDNLYTLEIGNEPNFYSWFNVPEYVKRYRTLQKNLINKIPALNDKKIFQALDTAANHAKELTAKASFEQGLNDITASIKQVGFHYYQGHGPKTFSELQDWVRHSLTVENMSNFTPNIRYLQNKHPYIGFAFTETGYNVGSGGGELGNNLATALWAVDFQLYCMTVNVTRINWQQILASSLNMWRGVESKAGPARVSPNFYSQPFIADFIGKGGKTSVAPLDVGGDGDGKLVAYAAYESGKLARIALLNLDLWTSDNGTRPHVKVNHLSAPNGALAEAGLTYAGLEWTLESNGTENQVKNDSNVLEVGDTGVTVSVNATSAVMVVL
ncbi:hypothetical protein F4677DRAFT_453065 [Hypoxylon crocopeplum]|nr:hypothetical protein F4677DRAFT_453065 [Hypoxylon crocopeplum]